MEPRQYPSVEEAERSTRQPPANTCSELPVGDTSSDSPLEDSDKNIPESAKDSHLLVEDGDD